MENKKEEKSKGKRIFFVILSIGIFLWLAILIPDLPIYAPSRFCSMTESDANHIAAAMADYFSVAQHRTINQVDIEKMADIKSPWKLTKCGDTFYIHVIDRTGKCPDEYQNKDPDWNSNIYTLKF